ncbi:MAG: hypothetical protein OK436_02380, partial [Thaumarchaeota archaeon]|nr:hypothetical protein [Nitrososphaerota archaeon]
MPDEEGTHEKYEKLVEERDRLLEEREGLKQQASPTLAWLRRWLFTTDHKDVGILYFVTSIWFLLIGGVLAS